MVTINIGRKEAVFFGVIILVLAVVGFGVAAWDSSKTMYHEGADVKVVFNGSVLSLNEALSMINAGGGFGGGSGGMSFGDWESKSSGTTYQAGSDGFVVVRTGNIDNSGSGWQRIYSDGSSSPSTICASSLAEYGADRDTLICPVKEADYWKVTGGTPLSVRWLPIVSSGGSGGYVPSTYAGEESVTFPNGMIMKMGIGTGLGSSDKTVTFDTAFPNAVKSVTVTIVRTQNYPISTKSVEPWVYSVTKSSFKIKGGPDVNYAGGQFYWTAIGY